MAKIGSFLACWILRVANFGINYLRHFFINFKIFCAHCAANFLNFLKHPHYITFWWFWRKLWPKIRKLRNQKICQFEPTLKSSLFSGWNFSIFFHPYAQRVPNWKIAHIWQSKEPKNTKKTRYNVSVICCQSLPVVLQHPVSCLFTVVEELIFCISATPHLGTSFPLFHDKSCGYVRSSEMFAII